MLPPDFIADQFYLGVFCYVITGKLPISPFFFSSLFLPVFLVCAPTFWDCPIFSLCGPHLMPNLSSFSSSSLWFFPLPQSVTLRAITCPLKIDFLHAQSSPVTWGAQFTNLVKFVCAPPSFAAKAHLAFFLFF